MEMTNIWSGFNKKKDSLKCYFKENPSLPWLFLVYFIMHGGILFIPNAIYWDDWTLYRTAPATVLDVFKQAGSMFNLMGYMHVGMLAIGPYTYKLTTFLVMFASGVFLNGIIKRSGVMNEESRFFTCCLFMVLPFYMARVAIIDFPYTICYFLFFLGWYIAPKNKFLAAIIFFLSFNTNSLILYYPLPILELYFFNCKRINIKSIAIFVWQHSILIVSPIVFYLVKIKFFQPYGLYEKYNQGFGFIYLRDALEKQMQAIDEFSISPVLFVCLLPLAWWISSNNIKKYTRLGFFRALLIIIIGVVAFGLGGFPYWLLKYAGLFSDWFSRYQLLLPLGLALALVGITGFMHFRIRVVSMAIILAVSFSYGIENYYHYLLDWKKQKEFMGFVQKNQDISNSNLIIILDKSLALNTASRDYRFYEWNGMMETVFNNQTRYAVPFNMVDQYLNYSLNSSFTEQMKAAKHHIDLRKPITMMTLEDTGNRSPFNTLLDIKSERITADILIKMANRRL